MFTQIRPPLREVSCVMPNSIRISNNQPLYRYQLRGSNGKSVAQVQSYYPIPITQWQKFLGPIQELDFDALAVTWRQFQQTREGRRAVLRVQPQHHRRFLISAWRTAFPYHYILIGLLALIPLALVLLLAAIVMTAAWLGWGLLRLARIPLYGMKRWFRRKPKLKLVVNR